MAPMKERFIGNRKNLIKLGGRFPDSSAGDLVSIFNLREVVECGSKRTWAYNLSLVCQQGWYH